VGTLYKRSKGWKTKLYANRKIIVPWAHAVRRRCKKMPLYPPRTSLSAEKNYSVLREFMKRISYKPGWNISIRQEQNNYGFVVEVVYDGYESENAAPTPLAAENEQVTRVRARLMGKTLREPERRYFRKEFSMSVLENMSPENIVKYIIAETIKHAELMEFDRWFKVDGFRVFGEGS